VIIKGYSINIISRDASFVYCPVIAEFVSDEVWISFVITLDVVILADEHYNLKIVKSINYVLQSNSDNLTTEDHHLTRTTATTCYFLFLFLPTVQLHWFWLK